MANPTNLEEATEGDVFSWNDSIVLIKGTNNRNIDHSKNASMLLQWLGDDTSSDFWIWIDEDPIYLGNISAELQTLRQNLLELVEDKS